MRFVLTKANCFETNTKEILVNQLMNKKESTPLVVPENKDKYPAHS